MMAASKIMLDQEPSEIEMLLPWHAAGTLNPRDARRVEEALARDPELARQYAVIREEYAETIALNESLGAPSARAMTKLFAAIEGEPARHRSASLRLSTRISEFFAETIALNESLGAPSARAMTKLFAAIEGEPARHRSASLRLSTRISEFFA